jgi:2'-5' RNA ligase
MDAAVINPAARAIWRREDWQRMAALHLVHHGGHAVRAAARILRLPKSTIHDWVRQGPASIRDERLRAIAQRIIDRNPLTASEESFVAEVLARAEHGEQQPNLLSEAESAGCGCCDGCHDACSGECCDGCQQAQPTGVMVAFFLPADVAQQLAMDREADPTAMPPEELHVTLAFLGQAAELADPGRLCRVVAGFAAVAPPVMCAISGAGRFAVGDRVVYASVDAPQLPAWRQRLVEHLALGGYPPSTRHGFTPHVTLCNPDGPVTLDVRPIEFAATTLTVAIAGARYDFPLEGESATFAEPKPDTPPARPDPDSAAAGQDLLDGLEQALKAAKRVAQNHKPVEGPGEPGDAEEHTRAETADDELDEIQEHPPTQIMDRLALEAWHRYITALANDSPHSRAIYVARKIDPDFFVTDEQGRKLIHALGKGDEPVIFGWAPGNVKPPPHVTSVFDQFEGSAQQERELASYLFDLAKESYLEGVNAQLLVLGLSLEAAVTDPTVLSELGQATASIAQGIINSYNRALAAEVYSAWIEQRSTLGRQSSLRTLWEDVNRWAEARAHERAGMISATEYGRWFNRGVLDFLSHNEELLGSDATVYVTPDECLCSLCATVVAGSPYTLAEAQQLGLPLHPNCVHFAELSMSPVADLAVDVLWTAQLADVAA